MKTLLFFLAISNIASVCLGITELISTEMCYGYPGQAVQVDGAVVNSSPDVGKKLCYFKVTNDNYYFSVKIDKLNLAKVGSLCPTFSLGMFVKTETIPSQDLFLSEAFERPSDLKIMVTANCNNYTSAIGKVYTTIQSGMTIELNYDPSVATAPIGAYAITLTAYDRGESYNCQSGYYRCWNDKYKCIPESLRCDGFDNCFDDSDENHYQCTGKIGELTLPLFIIILIACFLFLVFLAINCVLCMRSRRLKKAEKRGLIQDMNLAQPMLAHDYYPDVYSDQSHDPSVM